MVHASLLGNKKKKPGIIWARSVRVGIRWLETVEFLWPNSIKRKRECEPGHDLGLGSSVSGSVWE